VKNKGEIEGKMKKWSEKRGGIRTEESDVCLTQYIEFLRRFKVCIISRDLNIVNVLLV